MSNARTAFRDKILRYVFAGYPLLWVQTHEENRAVADVTAVFGDSVTEEGKKRKRNIYEWDVVRGLSKTEKKVRQEIADTAQPVKALEYIGRVKDRNEIFLLHDFHAFFQSMPVLVRALRNLTSVLKARGTTIIITSPVLQIPVELEKSIQLVEYSLPDEAALEERLLFTKRSAELDAPTAAPVFDLPDEVRYQAIEAAKGLTDSEAENAFALALITEKKFNDKFVDHVFGEKVLQIKKGGLLTYLPPDVTFDQIGGLTGLKVWITQRGLAYRQDARAYGLPYPKGALFCGVPGCGKTLLAKATSHALNMPLFQLDIGSLFGKMVGDTEQNFRKVLQLVDGVGRCILFVDEIEKALNRNAVSGAGDSGTSSRSFGTLLSWLSDHKSPVFVIGTTNDFTVLPPEFIRKGRFDELFWLDLPNEKDRQAILSVLLTRYKQTPSKFNLPALSRASEKFTGAEIEQCIVSAMFGSFAEGKSLADKRLLDEFGTTAPHADINRQALENMRMQAKGKLRMAAEDGKVEEVAEFRNLTVSA